jgi:predicted RNA-binding protein
MTYWLYITNSANWRVTRETSILGASERHRNALARMNTGDKCLVYVKSEKTDGDVIGSQVVGEYEITSKLFEDTKKIFKAPTDSSFEVFRLRINLKPLKVLENPIKFKPLVPALTFIKNKKKWSLGMRGKAVIQIPKNDYNFILSKTNQ